MREATTIPILKTDEDLEEVDSYRPISLLMYDPKIQATTVTRRPRKLIFNVISSQKERAYDLAALSLSAVKAVDLLERPYLFTTLRQYDLGKQKNG